MANKLIIYGELVTINKYILGEKVDIINKDEILLAGHEVKKIINEIANEVVRGVLEEKDGPDWFNKLRSHMKDYNKEKEKNYKGQYNEAYKYKSYQDFDITLCFYLFSNDYYYKNFFRFEGNVYSKIKDIKNVRNSFSHDVNYSIEDLTVGISKVSDVIDALNFYYGDKYFTDSLADGFRKRINDIKADMNKINNETPIETIREVPLEAGKAAPVKRGNKKIKYTVAIAIVIILSALAIGNFIKVIHSAKKSLETVQNRIESSDKTASSTEEIAKDVIDQSRTQLEQQKGDGSSNQESQTGGENAAGQSAESKVLDFSDNPKVQQITGNFAVGVEKIEFNANNTVIYMTYDNKYNGDAALMSVRLDVGNETYQMDWIHGAAELDKMLAMKNLVVKINLPKKLAYEEGMSISLIANIVHYGSLGAKDVSGKNVNIQIQ